MGLDQWSFPPMWAMTNGHFPRCESWPMVISPGAGHDQWPFPPVRVMDVGHFRCLMCKFSCFLRIITTYKHRKAQPSLCSGVAKNSKITGFWWANSIWVRGCSRCAWTWTFRICNQNLEIFFIPAVRMYLNRIASSALPVTARNCRTSRLAVEQCANVPGANCSRGCPQHTGTWWPFNAAQHRYLHSWLAFWAT